MKLFYSLSAVLLLFGTSAQAQKTNKTKAVARPVLEQGATAPDGKRVGKWNFYNRSQELELTFDYDSSRIVFAQVDTARYPAQVGDQWQLKQLARAPHVMGSADERLHSLQKTLRYPPAAMMVRQQGTVTMAYTVATDGHTTDYTVVQDGGRTLNEEVWRAVQTLPDRWIPAIYQGRPVATRFYLTVRFKLMSEDEAEQLQSTAGQQNAADSTNTGKLITPTPRFKQEIVVGGFTR